MGDKTAEKQFIVEFIEVYRGLPALWDVKCKEYSNRAKKGEQYDVLIGKYREKYPDVEKQDVVKKINSLRTNFRKELKRIRDAEKSGAGAEDVEPSLWYFEEMRFLQIQETPTASISTMNIISQDVIDVVDDNDDRGDANETCGRTKYTMAIEIEQLCHQIEADLDEYISKLLQEEREMEGEEDKFNQLKGEIESLKIRKARRTEEMRAVSDEDEELSHRLKLVQSELLNNESANEGQKETLKYLMKEVVEMEHEKENRVDKMKKDYTSLIKLWKIYKAYLDLRIALVKPDMYRISFSAAKGAPTSLTLQSFPDLKDWEVMEVNGKPELEEELRAYLAETNDILGVMCKARRSCRK